SLHATHAQEEGQHLVTNVAYLKEYFISPEEQARASETLMENINQNFLHIVNLYAPIKLIQELFPKIKIFPIKEPDLFKVEFFQDILEKACFRPFREAIPDLETRYHRITDNYHKNKNNSKKTRSLKKQPDIVFLLSAPRSGSTLLRAMLSAHKQLFCPPELNLLSFCHLQEREELLKSGQGDGLAQALAELDNIDAQAATDEVANWLKENRTTEQVYLDLLTKTKQRNLITIDKSPHYAQSLNILEKAEQLFGDRVRYIHLLRHPYPAILSFVRLGMERLYQNSEQENISSAELGEYTWTIYNRNILDFLATIDNSRHYRIHYEQLMQNPETELSELCQFLELDFDSNMLQPYEKGSMLQPLKAESLTGDPNFLQKTAIDPSRGDAWRTSRLPHTPSLSLQNIAAEVGYELPENSEEKDNAGDNLTTEESEISPYKLEIRKTIQKIIGNRLKINPEQVPLDVPFTSLGLASLSLMRLVAKLEEKLGYSLGAMTFFDFPTIESLTQHLITEYPQPKKAQISDNNHYLKNPNPDMHPEANRVYDTYLAEYLENSGAVKFTDNPSSVVLTGTTGFLGAHLLADFLEITQAEIICPVRAKSPQNAYLRIYQSLEKYDLWQDEYAQRIQAIPADLSKPKLGVNTENYHRMAAADLICHNAAQVDFLATYEQLKPANVIGTCEILKLTVADKTKPLHYISSGAVFGTYLNGSQQRIFESDGLQRSEGLFLGYMQSKWVAEKLVWRAYENHGMPIAVYRPAIIGVNTITGAKSSAEFLYRFLQTCFTLNAYPDLPDLLIDASPVNYVSKAVVSLSLRRDSQGNAFHLNHPQAVSINTLIETLLNETELTLQKIKYSEWLKLLQQQNTDTKLGSLKMLFEPLWEGNRNMIDFRRFRPLIDAEKTRQKLEIMGLNCPPLIDKKFLQAWFTS
ncbi:MAG: thioester reductase domain-containing protein, partial [Cyanobacteria bacterium J06635_10]